MLRHTRILNSALLVGALSCSIGTMENATAGCNCQGNAGGGAVPMHVDGGMSGYDGGMVDYAPLAAPLGMGTTMVGIADGTFNPPPGTLGRTYQLRSRPVPTSKHPRAGMIDVRVAGAVRVIVHDLNEYRTEDKLDGFRNAEDPSLYHFTSEPLLPGIPHIYRVEAHIQGASGITVEERFVRLIRGRVVYLNF
ncbi:MAG: hypothetical protein KDA58_04845 [Planctomycetaceae bacterium]|nr:hypothetical protein [Planctomycetaceae bacterium]